MKKALTMLCICTAGLAIAQTNLVQNYSFEDVTGTLECIAGPTPSWHNSWATNTQEDLEAYWAQVSPWAPPAMGAGGKGAGSADHFCDGGNTGQNYGSGTNREYICAPLATNLVAGRRYMIEFYVKASSTLTNAGLKFSEDRPKQTGYLQISIDGQPHFEIDNSQVFSWSVWTRVRGFYTPDVNYDWITIGTFDSDRDAQSTFAIDDIKVVEWVDECPPWQLVENWNYDGFTDFTIKASDYLYAGYDVGAVSANGSVIVPENSNIWYKAGTEVGLLDGFAAVYESEFRAFIAPCGSDCTTPDAFAGISQTICDGESIQLGDDPVPGYTYYWASIPASAVQYLSSTTVSDPVFTPPPGEGDVRFYIVVTNLCGQVGSNVVSIHYDDTPSAVAQFSLDSVELGDQPSFDVLINSDVETISIEVLDPSLTTIYYQELFHHLLDFQCCDMPWMLPTQLSPCLNYKIRVTVTNYCTGATAEQILDWNPNQGFALTAPVPNVFTPDNNGINDMFCVNFTGAPQVVFEARSSAGVLVHYFSGTVYPPMACLWDGSCTQGPPGCLNSGVVEDGTYFYILKFYDCDGREYEYTGFVTVLSGNGRWQQYPVEDSVVTASTFSSDLYFFPNPSTGKISVMFNEEGPVLVEIMNMEGQLVQSTQLAQPGVVELSPTVANGVYIVRFTVGDETSINRLVIQRSE